MNLILDSSLGSIGYHQKTHSSGKSIVTRQVVEQKKLLSSHQPTVSDKVERIPGAGGLFLI